jgi:hypothetical protein
MEKHLPTQLYSIVSKHTFPLSLVIKDDTESMKFKIIVNICDGRGCEITFIHKSEETQFAFVEGSIYGMIIV